MGEMLEVRFSVDLLSDRPQLGLKNRENNPVLRIKTRVLGLGGRRAGCSGGPHISLVDVSRVGREHAERNVMIPQFFHDFPAIMASAPVQKKEHLVVFREVVPLTVGLSARNDAVNDVAPESHHVHAA